MVDFSKQGVGSAGPCRGARWVLTFPATPLQLWPRWCSDGHAEGQWGPHFPCLGPCEQAHPLPSLPTHWEAREPPCTPPCGG